MSKMISIGELIKFLADLPAGRQLIAIVGAPASGKSTLAKALMHALNRDYDNRSAVLAMDGYHLDDLILNERGLRARKGAPHTYDVPALLHMLERLKANAEPEIFVPLFDREKEIARAGAAAIPQDVEVILVEGNYLLLDQAPWDQLAPLFDHTIMVDVKEETLRERLSRRWVELGLAADEITQKLEENDLPNGRLVKQHSIAADIVVEEI